MGKKSKYEENLILEIIETINKLEEKGVDTSKIWFSCVDGRGKGRK